MEPPRVMGTETATMIHLRVVTRPLLETGLEVAVSVAVGGGGREGEVEREPCEGSVAAVAASIGDGVNLSE